MNEQMDDHWIEAYLRSFQPLPPAPLPKRDLRWRFLALSAAATVMVALLLLPRFGRGPSALDEPQPITFGGANELLTGSSSWKVVIDDAGFAFRPSSANIAPRHKSAIEFLSQENLLQ